ncbi:MAG: acetyl-CoA acetyltransferase [Epulopiscium sp. Nele67-Bin002]|nr:MAG: acetyl-CoA acetyltransferase [Epulopiscium sp. Nele67-Bin002]
MSKVYIVTAKRSAVGKFCGTLSNITPAELAAQVIKQTLADAKVEPQTVDEVILGSVLQAGQGQGIARAASVWGGIGQDVPAYCVNMICGSGMKSVMLAYAQIKAGLANIVVSGGVEVMSQAPFVTAANIRQGHKMGSMELKDSIIIDGLTDMFNNYHMGITAENIADKYGISREAQDEFALNSQSKAIAAIDSKKFEDEIVPVKVKIKRDEIVFDEDEYPNRKTTAQALAGLRAAFKKDGSVTAGNASGLNDGASIVIIASEEAVKKYNLTPMAEIIALGQGGVDPAVMGLGPVPAIKNALDSCNMRLKDMDLIELNEAFAVQSLGVIEGLKENYPDVTNEWFDERTNVNGGAIAIGHPLGASGARITTTLVHEMKKRNLTYGLASLCIGGGMGTALIVKNV